MEHDRFDFVGMVVGFFHDTGPDDYKVVKILYEKRNPSLTAEVYSLKSQERTKTGYEFSVSPKRIMTGSRIGMVQNGNLYWILGRNLGPDEGLMLRLNVYNVAEDRFESEELPINASNLFLETHRLWIFRGSLTIMGFWNSLECELWMMNDVPGSHASWTKRFPFLGNVRTLPQFTVMTAGRKIAMVDLGGRLMKYDPEARKAEYPEHINNVGFPHDEINRFFYAEYVEILVSVIRPSAPAAQIPKEPQKPRLPLFPEADWLRMLIQHL